MKITIVAFLALSFNLTDGKLPQVSKGRRLAPEAVGAYHTDALDLLGEKYSKEKPVSIRDVARDLGAILASYCSEDDDACKIHAYTSARDEFKRNLNEPPRSIYPQEFPSELKDSIDELVINVENVDELNLDTVLHALNNIKEEIEDMTGVAEHQKMASLVGVSVAMESTKLWHATYYDNGHPLHDMINYFDPENDNRRLQPNLQQITNLLGIVEDFGIDPTVILADITAALNIGLPAIQTNFANVTGVFDLGFADVLFFMPVVSASAAAFFAGGGYYDYKYEYEYDYNDECKDTVLEALGICI